MSEYVFRLSSDGGMMSLAALDARAAGHDVERLLASGAETVEVERVLAASVDVDDVWGVNRMRCVHGKTLRDRCKACRAVSA